MLWIKSLVIGLVLVIFTGCAGGSKSSNISKIYEADYPDGISVIFHNEDLQDDLEIVSSRMANGKYKKQLQLVIKNSSSETYNVVLGHEWSDSRGIIINNKMLKNKMKIGAKSSQRVILNAPNFKAKNVLLNISCGTPCKKEK